MKLRIGPLRGFARMGDFARAIGGALVLCSALIVLYALMVSCALLAPAAFAQGKTPAAASELVARVGETGFILVKADSFHALTPKQQAMAYWLAQSSIAIDPIIYDQLSKFGLRQKRLLEEIVAQPSGIDPQTMSKITDFTELFWANRGNHSEENSQKFLPSFTFDDLKKAATIAQENGAMKTAYGDLPSITTSAQLDKELQMLRASFFDANFEPMDTAKSPGPGEDIVQASSNTFYPGLSLADLKGFHEQHPLNSRVVKDAQGKLHEEVYRAGTPDGKIPAGLYAVYLKKTIACLQRARAFADPQEAQVIADLIRYYETGDFNDWLKFDADWVQDDATVDFSNGFVEIYRDARGAKGSSASFVSITDKPVTDTMAKLASNAAYFEEKAPWDEKYKKKSFKLPVVKAVETLIEAGDYEVNTIGDNLPNENEIREKFGSKNFLLTSSTRALNDAIGNTATDEFGPSPEVIARDKKYGDEAEDLETALHEVIGHGSGKLSDRLAHGSEPELKEYFSTLEEGRADLMAFWNVWDPKLKELGLISNQEEVAKAMYDAAARVALMQLRRMPKGDTIEEDHARDRQLIVRYIMDKTGGIEQFKRDGKTYIQVTDYQKMHQGVGMLLAELMRIKAEGDYDAIKALVDKYGVHFDPALRDEIVARYQKLGLPSYWAGINSKLTARFSESGQIESVEISYPGDPASQYLYYASMYDKGLMSPVATHKSASQ
jgi:dipeptidyl-peptidase III